MVFSRKNEALKSFDVMERVVLYSPNPLSWQAPQWHLLNESRAQGRLPHGLLMTGPEGVGKSLFAHQFAQSLLCDGPQATGAPCGECRGCQLVEAGTHPDLSIVSPDEGKKNISVDQIRGVGNYLGLKSQFGRSKVVIVAPADAMNVNASNSLLKTLEEPTEGSVLILASSRPAQLPATIRSRCQEVRFGEVEKSVAFDWLRQNVTSDENPATLLALANGAPLKAAEMADKGLVSLRKELFEGLEKLASQQADPIKLASQWVSAGAHYSLHWMYSWITDMVRLKVTGSSAHIANEDMAQQLASLASQLTLNLLIKQQDRVLTALRQAEHNFNVQLIFEDLLIQWRRCFVARNRKTVV